MEISGLCSRHCCGLYARKLLVIVHIFKTKIDFICFQFHIVYALNWNDYTGTDADVDGIGDSPYTDTPFGIDENSDNHPQMATDPDSWLSSRDNYPLMAPWDNYFA